MHDPEVSLLTRLARALLVPDDRTIASLPMVRIADARSEERVRVRGRVVESNDGLLTAPFTGRSVVWFRARYEVFREEDQPRMLPRPPQHDELEVWRTELVHVMGRPFLIDDGSGLRARVAGELATAVMGYEPPVQLIEQRVTDASYIDGEPEAFRAFMSSYGIATHEYMGAESTRRFYENAFSPGDEIIVAGIARREAGAPEANGYRSGSTEVLALHPAEFGLVVMRPRVLG